MTSIIAQNQPNQASRPASETTVFVGMSGGVDSSVAALLLKQQGYRVVGLFMKNWEDIGPDGRCSSEDDFADVVRVCQHLDIPYYSVEFVKEYWDQVFQEMVQGYAQGDTPNPDILCNREIKFAAFYNKARALGADFVATGHYCQLGTDTNNEPTLLKGMDPGKDQSYFLCEVESAVLKNVMFPIGHLPKSEVRRLALENGIPTHSKKDSTGICFIGERKFKEFLQNYLPAQKGEFRTLDGTYLGPNEGAFYYTIGQRKGLGLGGQGEPYFVIDKDVKNNVVYVERGGNHPGLFASELIAGSIHWIGQSEELPFQGKAKIRYRQEDQECEVIAEPGGETGQVRVRFETPQRAIAPGQYLVLYKGERCLGGAPILSVVAERAEPKNPGLAYSSSESPSALQSTSGTLG